MNGTTIDAARYNGLTGDVATGITACLAKNGENAPTANLPMGGFKHTGAADGGAAGQYLVYGQGFPITAFALGGVTTPSITFTGDLNTGIWSPGADQIAISTGGTQRYSINAAGTHTIAAPSSGNAFIINQFAGANGLVVSGAGAGTASEAQIKVLDTRANSTRLTFSVDNSAAYVVAGGSSANPDLIFSNNDGTLEMLRLAADGSLVRTGVGSGAASKYRALNWSNYYADFGIDAGGITYINAVNNGTVGPTEFRRNGTVTLTLATDGRIYGTALHNNAGAVTGTVNQYIASGTYTPTATNVTNAPSCSVSECQWMRVGNTVIVSGAVTTGTLSAAAPTTTQIGISLPIASNFTALSDLAGAMGFNSSWNSCDIFADTTNDRATLDFVANTTTGLTRSFTFFYEVK